MRPLYLTRQTHWDYMKARRWGETFEGHPLLWELAGPGGAHYHMWFPEGTRRREIRATFERLRSNQDLVSASYDFIKPFTAEELT